MPFDVPFVLGPFTVDRAGRLLPNADEPFPAFSLDWRGRAVEVWLARPPEGGVGRIGLRASLGRVPSTAGGGRGRPGLGGRGGQRAAVFAALRGLPGLLPAGWRMELLADHSVGLVAEAALALPATAAALLGVVTGFLLDAAPYLDLLEESGVAAGTVNTWPG